MPTYPGVYIEEVPSGVRTIAGVSTSVAAFIGTFSKGPINHGAPSSSIIQTMRCKSLTLEILNVNLVVCA